MPSYAPRSATRQWLVNIDEQLQKELRNEVEIVSAQQKLYLENVTSDWKHKPQFRRKMTVSPQRIQATVIAVGKNKKIFAYVDKGTRPHKIKASAGKLLVFRLGYSPRTAPPVEGKAPQGKVGTGKATGSFVSIAQVQHPGNAPRKFAETFEKDMQPDFARRIHNAIRRAVSRAS